MKEIEQIIASNIGNRLTRELAAGLLIAIIERVDVIVREAQKKNEEPAESEG